MRGKLMMGFMVALSLMLAAGTAWAQMGGQGMMMRPGQSQPQGQSPQPGSGYGSGYGPGMMGQGYGGYGMMGPGMMAGYGGGYGGGMMGMMMGHMMGGGYGMMGSGGYGGGMMSMGYMLPYLNLSAQQWDKVRGLASQRLEKMSKLRTQLFQQNQKLFNLANRPKVDAAKVKKLFVRQAGLRAELFLAGLDYLKQVEKVLTPKQKQQLNRGWGVR